MDAENSIAKANNTKKQDRLLDASALNVLGFIIFFFYKRTEITLLFIIGILILLFNLFLLAKVIKTNIGIHRKIIYKCIYKSGVAIAFIVLFFIVYLI